MKKKMKMKKTNKKTNKKKMEMKKMKKKAAYSDECDNHQHKSHGHGSDVSITHPSQLEDCGTVVDDLEKPHTPSTIAPSLFCPYSGHVTHLMEEFYAAIII